MSRKDYQLIARAIYETCWPMSDQVQDLVCRLAYDFKEDNPRFDTAKFAEACENGV